MTNYRGIKAELQRERTRGKSKGNIQRKKVKGNGKRKIVKKP